MKLSVITLRQVKTLLPPSLAALALHVILALSVFAAAAAVLNSYSAPAPLAAFLFLCICMVAVGAIHCWAMYHFHDWAKKEGAALEFLFSLTIYLAGIGVFWVTLPSPEIFRVPFTASLILFMLPLIMVKFCEYSIIPKSIYPSLVPNRDPYRNPPFMEFVSSQYGVLLFFEDGIGGEPGLQLPDGGLGVDLPVNFWGVQLKNYFYSVLHLYAREFPHKAIPLADEENGRQPYRWQFRQRGWFPGTWKYLDHEKTFAENHIQFNWKWITGSTGHRKVRVATIHIIRIL